MTFEVLSTEATDPSLNIHVLRTHEGHIHILVHIPNLGLKMSAKEDEFTNLK